MSVKIERMSTTELVGLPTRVNLLAEARDLLSGGKGNVVNSSVLRDALDKLGIEPLKKS